MSATYPFDHIITKLRTTRGSEYALGVMREAADEIERLAAEHERLTAKVADWEEVQDVSAQFSEHASLAAPPTDDEYDSSLAVMLSTLISDEPMWSCVVVAKKLHAAGFRRQGPITGESQPEFAEMLANDGIHEYTISSDCDGSNVKHWRRNPKRVTSAGPWEPVAARDAS